VLLDECSRPIRLRFTPTKVLSEVVGDASRGHFLANHPYALDELGGMPVEVRRKRMHEERSHGEKCDVCHSDVRSP
jgi:hypothetical protein